MMRKGRALPVLAVLVCLFILASLHYGCGSSGTACIENPLEFFKQTREKMNAAASFRMSGVMDMEYSDFHDEETYSIHFDMAMEKKGGGDALIKMNIRAGGPWEPRMVAYVTADRMYFQMPDGTWVYEDEDLHSDFEEMERGFGPQYVMDVLDMAESAEVTAEDNDYITYSLEFDPEKLMQETDLEDLKASLEESGVSEEDVQEIMEGEMRLISEMEMTMSVDKGSGMAARFGIDLEMDHDLLSSLSPDDPPPRGATVTVHGVFETSDYGRVFDLALPDEAEDAIPLEDLEKILDA